MKTAEDFLFDALDLCGLKTTDNINNTLISAMQEYAQQVAEDVRQRCADKALMKVHDGHFKTDNPSTHVQIGANNVQIDKQSIINTEIILP